MSKTHSRPTPETRPDGEHTARCSYCERPFPSDHLRALHVGHAHPDACTEAELAEYETAENEETDELFLFHLQVIAAIGLLYAGFVLVYMVVLG